jgi:cytochrome o ubiquinol oxidase operon protein cyoD
MKKLAAYATGFVLSVALTVLPLVALWMRDEGSAPLSPAMLYAAFVLFALIQLCVQLSFFLHIDEEERPRFNLVALCFALLVVCIVAGGTLWVMHDLSHMKHGPQVPFIGGVITPQQSND